MNLHSVSSRYVSSVNPMMLATIQESIGYTTDIDGSRVSSYASPVTVMVQRQALQQNDIYQLSGVNIQGERCAMYINGDWKGVVREDGSGGDLITLPDGSLWLVVFVFEDWGLADGWVKVCACRQMQ